MRTLSLAVALALTAVVAAARQSSVPTFDQIIELKRPGGVDIAPDGSKVAFTVTEANWEDNAYETEIFLASASRRSARACIALIPPPARSRH
jgi:dipeptidyl aminopeptidase/acylaminoacyl peptidase